MDQTLVDDYFTIDQTLVDVFVDHEICLKQI